MTHRPQRRPRWLRSALGAALVLALAHAPSYGRHPDLELDALGDGQLDALLQAELDDEDLMACGLADPRAPVPKDEMLDIILCALGDDGDDDDEDDIDDDDLEAEMEEANTTLEAQVLAALERADVLASGPTVPDAALARAAQPGDEPTAALVLPGDERAWPLQSAHTGAPTARRLPDQRLALRDGRINPGKAAVVPVKLAIRSAIRAAR